MNLIRRVLCTILCLSLIGGISAFAVELPPIRDYETSGFTDVPNDWSQPYIVTCYELGLVSGRGEGVYAPSGTVSIAEGITVAARIHDLWQGGDGDIPGGTPWYTGAVDYALENGLITAGEFSDYTAAASRAELAGLLARVLPTEDYAPINNITSLPDVNSTTPYSQSIFTLYNAGILTGSDIYGTFSPREPINRAAFAAILCRLVQPDTRMTLDLQDPPPGPAIAYTSDKLLWVGNVPFAGMVVIEGEYYFPMELLSNSNYAVRASLRYYGSDSEYSLYKSSYSNYYNTLMGPVIAAPAGVAIGETTVSSLPLKVGDKTLYNVVRTLNGRYPMVQLSALADTLGYRDDGISILICGDTVVSDQNPTWEADLAGEAAASLQKGTAQATAQAIHDYLVNTLTHCDGMDKPYFDKTDPQRYERGEALIEQYRYINNYTLAWRYGVCQNYAELFQAMCVQSGIPCQIVTGEPDHAWNRVYLNGAWTYVDVTWDDPIAATPTIRQTYFMAGPDVMVQGHYWKDADYPMPAEYDPAWEQLDPNNITSADMFRKCLVAQVMQQKTSFSLRTTVRGAYGGSACIYAYPLGWWSMSGGYNSKTGTYDYRFEY